MQTMWNLQKKYDEYREVSLSEKKKKPLQMG